MNTIENQVKIINLKEGDTFEGKLLVTKIEELLTKGGKPYVSIDFSDDTGSVNSKVWDMSKDEFGYKKDEVVFLKAVVEKFKDLKQFKIADISHLATDDPDNNPNVFLKRAPLAESEIKAELNKYINIISSENKKYGDIVKYILKKYKDVFLEHPAAKNVHHNYLGGLAYHVIRMLKHGEALTNVYTSLNKPLLLAGILIHDAGKMEELRGLGDITYTITGRLLGHIVIGDTLICEAAKELNLDYEKDEEVLLLRHLVLAHHGKFEWGSPVIPIIPEATALHSIDKLDADIEQYEAAYQGIEKGETSPKVFGLNVEVYKAKNDGKDVE